MKRLKVAETNPAQGWGPEQKLNKRTYPALKELENLTNAVKSFIEKDLSKIDFEGNAENKQIIIQSLDKIISFSNNLKKLFQQYSAKKISYLRFLAKTFKQEHYQQAGQFIALANKILNILIQSRQYIPQERYLSGKELLTSLLEELKKLQTFIQKM